jgi:Kef-type K+ transport system membrane component KefB
VFVAAVFLVGKITGALGAPSLVGEILVGVLLGPPVLDFVPNPGVLMLVGEVGLVLLVVGDDDQNEVVLRR